MRVNKPHNKAILITIDCLRADHLKCYGYKRKTSPFLDYLAIKGVKFENAFANGPNTPSSFRSIFASGYPFEFIRPEPFAPDTVLLPEILTNNGVRTAAIHSNPHLSAFSPRESFPSSQTSTQQNLSQRENRPFWRICSATRLRCGCGCRLEPE